MVYPRVSRTPQTPRSFTLTLAVLKRGISSRSARFSCRIVSISESCRGAGIRPTAWGCFLSSLLQFLQPPPLFFPSSLGYSLHSLSLSLSPTPPLPLFFTLSQFLSHAIPPQRLLYADLSLPYFPPSLSQPHLQPPAPVPV